jgi:hypothetical protein
MGVLHKSLIQLFVTYSTLCLIHVPSIPFSKRARGLFQDIMLDQNLKFLDIFAVRAPTFPSGAE